MSEIQLLDCTLRDGAYIVNGKFGESAIKGIIAKLQNAGIDIIECGWLKDSEHEVGTTYFSDTYGYEDKLDILQKVSYDLTGNVIYPIARVQNDEADEVQNKAADDFIKFITSDAAKAVFDSYYFDTNVE